MIDNIDINCIQILATLWTTAAYGKFYRIYTPWLLEMKNTRNISMRKDLNQLLYDGKIVKLTKAQNLIDGRGLM